ncbi:hypothetical protein D3C83_114610 [compost metagenome]
MFDDARRVLQLRVDLQDVGEFQPVLDVVRVQIPQHLVLPGGSLPIEPAFFVERFDVEAILPRQALG